MHIVQALRRHLRRQSLTDSPIIEAHVFILVAWGLSMLIVYALNYLCFP